MAFCSVVGSLQIGPSNPIGPQVPWAFVPYTPPPPNPMAEEARKGVTGIGASALGSVSGGRYLYPTYGGFLGDSSEGPQLKYNIVLLNI